LKVNTLGELAIALRPDATAGVNGQPYTGETVTLQTGRSPATRCTRADGHDAQRA
ncbi:MAG: hypothetical protein HC838_01005, partial [Spirulinaceae cyanobacterium RM2_2_10]|nr:hypothetical protein [Spirulinaceae cyanobacterium RM2_2_10]